MSSPSRLWWPSCTLDEIAPTGRPRPEDWLMPDESGVTIVHFDDEQKHEAGRLMPGEVASFCWHESRGEIEITVFPDGTWSGDADGRCRATPDFFTGRADRTDPENVGPQEPANVFVWSEDREFNYATLDLFASDFAALDALPDEGVIVHVERHFWSDAVLFRIGADGKSLTHVGKENPANAQ